MIILQVVTIILLVFLVYKVSTYMNPPVQIAPGDMSEETESRLIS